MLYLAFIFHMHQPYYKNLLTEEIELPWVRLHGVKDYLDMAQILRKYPLIKQNFNIVPSLLEQINDYIGDKLKDRFLDLSYKEAEKLSVSEKEFILNNFFSINKDKVIQYHPRYLELFLKRSRFGDFETSDYLDLQVWFNLAWIDPEFRNNNQELARIMQKARFFTEEDKKVVLKIQTEILKEIIPAYRYFAQTGQIEFSVTPYYHPILPLLFDTTTAREANVKTVLPHVRFSFPEDARQQIDDAVAFYENIFKQRPQGMWPSEEAVSEHIIPFIMNSGLNWIVSDEAMLFKSLKKKRDTKLLYHPHLLKRKEGTLNIVFRDRNLSDLLGFVYHSWKAKDAVDDFMKHLENIHKAFGDKDILVTLAMDGENAWEYYYNDGHDFLNLLYERISESSFMKSTTISEYLKNFPPQDNIKHLASGSWIYGEFGKWIGNPYKLKAWECLAVARQELSKVNLELDSDKQKKAWKQMYICEGSDWFWWYGEDPTGDFDRLFRMHLANFYSIISKPIPDYLNKPLAPDTRL